jgi:hypothetical protein
MDRESIDACGTVHPNIIFISAVLRCASLRAQNRPDAVPGYERPARRFCYMECSKQGRQIAHGIAVHVGAGFKPAPASINAQRPSSTPPFPAFPDYDYSQAGAYFHLITACTQNRVMLFGEVIGCSVRLK